MALLQVFFAVACFLFAGAEQAPPHTIANAKLHHRLNSVVKEREFLKSRLVAETKKDDQKTKELAKKDQIIASLKKRLGSEEQKVKSLESRVESLEEDRVEALDELKSVKAAWKEQDEEREAPPPPEKPVPASVGENADNDNLEELGVKSSAAEDDDEQDADAAAVDPEAHWDEVINAAEPAPPADYEPLRRATNAAVHAIKQHSQESSKRAHQNLAKRMQAATDGATHALKQDGHERAVSKATDVAADIIQQHMDMMGAQPQQEQQQSEEEKIDLPPNEDDDDDVDDMAYETLENTEPIKTIPQLPLRKAVTKPAGQQQGPTLKAGPYQVKLDHAEIDQKAAAAMEAKHQPSKPIRNPPKQLLGEDGPIPQVAVKLEEPQNAPAKTDAVADSSEDSGDANDEAEVEAMEKDDAEEDAEERKLAEGADEDEEARPAEDDIEDSDLEPAPAAQEATPKKAPAPKQPSLKTRYFEDSDLAPKQVKQPISKPATKPASKPDPRAAARAARAKVVESAKALRAAAKQAVSDAAVSKWAQAQKVAKAKSEEEQVETVSHELRDVTSGEEALENKIDGEESDEALQNKIAKATATTNPKPGNFEEEALNAETSDDQEAAEDERMLDKLANDDNAN